MRTETTTEPAILGLSPHGAVPLLTVAGFHVQRALQGQGNRAHLHTQGAFIVILIELFKRFDSRQTVGDIFRLHQEIPHDVATGRNSAGLRESHGSSPDWRSVP